MRTKSASKNDVLSYLHQNGKHLETLFTHLPRFLGERKLAFEEINIPFLESFEAFLSEWLMPSAVKDRMSCLRTLVKRAIATGITTHDPFTEYRIVRPETDKPYFTPSQIKELLKVSGNIHPEVVSTFLFALYTGFHRAKIIKMTIAEALESTLSKKARELLHSIVKADKTPDSLLFEQLPCAAKYYQQVRIWAAFAGLSIRPTLEYARNTFIMNELARGLNIKDVAFNLGIKELRHLLAYEKIFKSHYSSLSSSSPVFPISVSERRNNFADKIKG